MGSDSRLAIAAGLHQRATRRIHGCLGRALRPALRAPAGPAAACERELQPHARYIGTCGWCVRLELEVQGCSSGASRLGEGPRQTTSCVPAVGMVDESSRAALCLCQSVQPVAVTAPVLPSTNQQLRDHLHDTPTTPTAVTSTIPRHTRPLLSPHRSILTSRHFANALSRTPASSGVSPGRRNHVQK